MNSKFEIKSFNFITWDWPMKSPKSQKENFVGGYSVKFKKAEGIISEYYRR